MKDLVGAQKLYSVGTYDRSDAASTLPKDQSELRERGMKESYQEAIIPLTDDVIKEKYINFYKGIRFGRILEDLDTFAVWIGYSHNRDPAKGSDQKSNLSIVTAFVDTIEVKHSRIQPDQDVKMSGHVTWAGKTSLEVTMQLEQMYQDTWKKILDAKFVMVARDPVAKRAAFVNPLKVINDEEKEIFEMGEQRKKKRQDQSTQSLLRTPPDAEERLLIHDLFLQTLDPNSASFRVRVKPENSVWMEETMLKTMTICHPEQRNLYNKVFGGFLMRKAFELAWANANLLCQSRPYVLAVDDILFRKPVEIGSLLFLSSQIVYTSGTKMQVKVHAEVVNPADGHHDTTNMFHFTFDSKKTNVPILMPKSYAEAMMYLEGKRHFER
ncbi:acyl-coenzyme A thioesterase 9, mitochondrial-like [Liolophura sinensis]|uniref:acyl-coenzyme A thioesterase 9, mitochondrial-like n=1 Tax=Liolophura sinensis TaxID=3198878 RepID=UPI003158F33C